MQDVRCSLMKDASKQLLCSFVYLFVTLFVYLSVHQICVVNRPTVVAEQSKALCYISQLIFGMSKVPRSNPTRGRNILYRFIKTMSGQVNEI